MYFGDVSFRRSGTPAQQLHDRRKHVCDRLFDAHTFPRGWRNARERSAWFADIENPDSIHSTITVGHPILGQRSMTFSVEFVPGLDTVSSFECTRVLPAVDNGQRQAIGSNAYSPGSGCFILAANGMAFEMTWSYLLRTVYDAARDTYDWDLAGAGALDALGDFGKAYGDLLDDTLPGTPVARVDMDRNTFTKGPVTPFGAALAACVARVDENKLPTPMNIGYVRRATATLWAAHGEALERMIKTDFSHGVPVTAAYSEMTPDSHSQVFARR